MLKKEFRLPSKEFQRIYSSGKKLKGSFGMYVVSLSDLEASRFAFVLKKKIGNAVQRHKMTRLLREVARKHLDNLSPIDAQYIAFEYSDNFEQLEKEFVTLLSTYFLKK